MTSLAIGASVTLALSNNGFLEVATNGGLGSVTITPTGGASASESFGPSPFRKKWNGPYPEGASVLLSNSSAASMDYETDSTNLPASVQALVSADGIQTWANRGLALAAGLTRCFITDVGIGGSYWDYLGGRWRPQARFVTLKNLTSSVTHNTTTRTVMDYATIPAGLWQDGDIVEMEWCKTLTGTDTDTTETGLGTAAATFGEAMNLSTAALTNTNPMLAARWRWRRLGATSVRPVTIGGSVGLGTAGAIVADPTITTNLDTTDAYLQISGKLTTGAGAVSALRACTWTLYTGS